MDEYGYTRSMSKKGCSPDNSSCEGFFGRMKNEMFYGREFVGVTIETFIQIINDYITWYNTKRIKASLGYMSPMETDKVWDYLEKRGPRICPHRLRVDLYRR